MFEEWDYIIVCEDHESVAREKFADQDEDYVVVCTDKRLCEWALCGEKP